MLRSFRYLGVHFRGSSKLHPQPPHCGGLFCQQSAGNVIIIICHSTNINSIYATTFPKHVDAVPLNVSLQPIASPTTIAQEDILEHSLKAQSLLLPSATSRRSLTDFFTRALSTFHSSSESAQKFQVIYTAPPSASSSHASASAAVQAQEKPYPQSPGLIPPTKRPHTLIVLDSSFNLPTLAHLRMAISAVEDIIK